MPSGRQDGLQSVLLRGEVELDPIDGDPFRILIEQRKLLDRRDDLSETERKRLGRALKVVANSAGYGIFAEVNQTQLGSRTEPIRIYGLDEPFEQRLHVLEEPGRFSFPPVAACITAAARLMLALLEHQVTEAGGSYVYCDTDAMAVVATKTGNTIPCPGGHHTQDGQAAVNALSWEDVDRICERFKALNPYDPAAIGDSILQVEEANFHRGRRRQLHAYSLSAKRYCLFTKSRDGTPTVHPKRRSEHGLGHLRNPIDPEREDRDWITEAWQTTINKAHGLPARAPQWASRPAVSQLTASSPNVLRPFNQYNSDLSYAEQVKPFNFLLTCQVAPLAHPPGYPPQRFQLIAPYTKDPNQWTQMKWTDRYSRDTFTIDTNGDLTQTERVQVHTHRTTLDRYRVNPEPKSLDPSGQICAGDTVGLLGRRPVTAALPTYIGKESNLLEERAFTSVEIDEAVIHYNDPSNSAWRTLVIPALTEMRTAEITERSGLTARQIQRLLRGENNPSARTQALLTAIATDHAATALTGWGLKPARDTLTCLTQFHDELKQRGTTRLCPICGTPAASRRATYCRSPACKKQAQRLRARRLRV